MLCISKVDEKKVIPSGELGRETSSVASISFDFLPEIHLFVQFVYNFIEMIRAK